MTQSGQLFALPTLVRRTDENGASSWPTHTTNSATYSNGERGPNLIEAAANWPTARVGGNEPSQQEMEEGDPKHRLETAAAIWHTPRVSPAAQYAEDSETRTRGGREYITLATQADQTWMTPTARDHRDGANPSENVATNSLLGRQAPRTPMPGQESSQQTRRLNPRFVEWLMGWPDGLTDLESWATASSRTKQPSPSASSVSD